MSLILFKQNAIRINTKYVNLDDLIDKAKIKTKFNKESFKFKPIIKEGNDRFVEPDLAIKILQHYNCNKILTKLGINDEIIDLDKTEEKSLKDQALDFGKNIFNFAQTECAFVKVEDEIYFKGKEIADFLGYENTTRAIRNHVDEDDKITFGEILKETGSVSLKKLKGNEKKYLIYHRIWFVQFNSQK